MEQVSKFYAGIDKYSKSVYIFFWVLVRHSFSFSSSFSLRNAQKQPKNAKNAPENMGQKMGLFTNFKGEIGKLAVLKIVFYDESIIFCRLNFLQA